MLSSPVRFCWAYGSQVRALGYNVLTRERMSVTDPTGARWYPYVTWTVCWGSSDRNKDSRYTFARSQTPEPLHASIERWLDNSSMLIGAMNTGQYDQLSASQFHTDQAGGVGCGLTAHPLPAYSLAPPACSLVTSVLAVSTFVPLGPEATHGASMGRC